MKRKTIALILAMGFFSPNAFLGTAMALDCKSINNSLQAEEKFGKTTHKAFKIAFSSFQKNRFNDSSYWKAFKLKYLLIKSDVRSGEIALVNASCFNASQVIIINYYIRERKEMLTSLTPYLSKAPNREWKYSGYAAYESLNYSLKRYDR